MHGRPLKAGVHTSIAGGLQRSVRHAIDLGCDCFQIFSRNPRGWLARPLQRAEVRDFKNSREQSGLWPLAVHAVYLINLAADDPLILEKSRMAFREEIQRAIALGADYLVVHPGNARSRPADFGIETAIDSIKQSARGLKLNGASSTGANGHLTILIENTAGQGSSIGCDFEQIADIVAGLDDLPLGVCLDTAHTLASGYDISTESGFKETVRSINRTFGFDRIRLIHCNDSKAPLGSRVDRHEHIGMGHIGNEGFRRITRHQKLGRIPFILETPIDQRHDDLWNLAAIRKSAERSESDQSRLLTAIHSDRHD